MRTRTRYRTTRTIDVTNHLLTKGLGPKRNATVIFLNSFPLLQILLTTIIQGVGKLGLSNHISRKCDTIDFFWALGKTSTASPQSSPCDLLGIPHSERSRHFEIVRIFNRQRCPTTCKPPASSILPSNPTVPGRAACTNINSLCPMGHSISRASQTE
jgi:hypothetical protein